MYWKIAVAALSGWLLTVSLAFAAEVKVVQKDKAFSLKELEIKVGDQITFVNADTTSHNVFSLTSGHEFEIKEQAPGKSDSVKFSKPGKFEVECIMHPKMKLSVSVKR